MIATSAEPIPGRSVTTICAARERTLTQEHVHASFSRFRAYAAAIFERGVLAAVEDVSTHYKTNSRRAFGNGNLAIRFTRPDLAERLEASRRG
jgi:hypothetical protein